MWKSEQLFSCRIFVRISNLVYERCKTFTWCKSNEKKNIFNDA